MNTNGSHINNWGAADFERYYSGKMPLQEMHAIEKDALDDPFLQDALEGYTHTKTAVEDIIELKNRLSSQDSKTKIIWYKKKSSLILLRIAALLILFAGITWVINKPEQQENAKIAAIKESVNVASVQDSNNADMALDIQENITAVKENTAAANSTNSKKISEPFTGESGAQDNIALAPINHQQTNDLAKGQPKAEAAVITQGLYTEKGLNGKISGAELNPASIIKGRVVDTDGQPVPFASIKDPVNNLQIAADKDGYFSLRNQQNVSNVNVNINAVGYETAHAYINQANASNNIVLKETELQLSEVVVSGAATKRSAEIKYAPATQNLIDAETLKLKEHISFENAEPLEGWKNFNKIAATVFANKKTFDTTGQVLLIFDIDATGAAKNIRVQQSLCKPCDAEAIRILLQFPALKKLNQKRKAEAEISL